MGSGASTSLPTEPEFHWAMAQERRIPAVSLMHYISVRVLCVVSVFGSSGRQCWNPQHWTATHSVKCARSCEKWCSRLMLPSCSTLVREPLSPLPDDAEDTGVVGFPSPCSSGCFLTVDGSKTNPSLSAGSSVRLGIT